jgi:predicted ArsR family transcriptional regulator
LNRLIAGREDQARGIYQARLADAPDLAAKIEALAAVRREEGYMAQARQDTDGSWVLIENHCPICAAAKECQQFCRSELALFQQLLQLVATVQREEHILAGARRCAYRIVAV